MTKARKKTLLWFAENDGAKFYPIGISKRMIASLVADGLLIEEKPPFGFIRTFITPAGRSALNVEEGNG